MISGGIAGLCLVVIGAALIVTDRSRADRAALQASIAELREALERAAGVLLVGAGERFTPAFQAALGRYRVQVETAELGTVVDAVIVTAGSGIGGSQRRSGIERTSRWAIDFGSIATCEVPSRHIAAVVK